MNETANQELSATCEHLETLVQEVLRDFPDLRDQIGGNDEVNRHLIDRLLIATDYTSGCLVLARAGLGSPLVPICRALFEGFVSIYWASQTDENGRRVLEAAKWETLRVMRLNLTAGHAKIVSKETRTDQTDKVLRDPLIKNAERPPRFDHMADAAGIKNIYDQLYGMLSLLSHASGTHILVNRDQKEIIHCMLHSAIATLRCIHLIVAERIKRNRFVSRNELEEIMKVALT
jgi:Family of unknown function (DUF5677)